MNCSMMTDWWSLGILIYELAFGTPPFMHSDENTLYDLISFLEVDFNLNSNNQSSFSDLFKNLIKKVYLKSYSKRILKFA